MKNGAPDPARKYCTPVQGKASVNLCNFCSHIMGGGITRVKNNFAHLDSQKNVKMWENVPPEMMEEMRGLILGNVEKKKHKITLTKPFEGSSTNHFTLTLMKKVLNTK